MCQMPRVKFTHTLIARTHPFSSRSLAHTRRVSGHSPVESAWWRLHPASNRDHPPPLQQATAQQQSFPHPMLRRGKSPRTNPYTRSSGATQSGERVMRISIAACCIVGLHLVQSATTHAQVRCACPYVFTFCLSAFTSEISLWPAASPPTVLPLYCQGASRTPRKPDAVEESATTATDKAFSACAGV
jgi:hypothetical protein